VWSS